jgi:hypothetical protein
VAIVVAIGEVVLTIDILNWENGKILWVVRGIKLVFDSSPLPIDIPLDCAILSLVEVRCTSIGPRVVRTAWKCAG